MNDLIRIENYLRDGETLLWSGIPIANIYFTPWDAVIVPFGLLCLWFLTKGSFSGNVDFGGIIFIAIIFYLTIGRFLTKYYDKKRTRYYLTNERIIIFNISNDEIVQEQDIKSVSRIAKKVNRKGIGRIEFGKMSITQLTGGNSGLDFFARTKLHKKFTKMNSFFDEGGEKIIPVFYDIKDVEYVYELVNKLRLP